MNQKRWISAVLSAWLIFGFGMGYIVAEQAVSSPSSGEELPDRPRIEERGLELGESSIIYPVITGLEDEELEKTVNDRILADTGVTDYVVRMSQLISGGRLRVNWRGAILRDIFSCAVSAEGAVTSPRSSFVWSWSSIDLRDGREILWEDLFTDPEMAREWIEAWLEEEIEPELSAHLLNGNVIPLPEGFYLTQRGLVLLYSSEQWNTLSDQAGDLLVGWNEIQDVLDLAEGSVLDRIGAGDMLNLTEESLIYLQDMTAEGVIPELPVRLGGSVREAVENWHLLIDPDLYENGRMISLESGMFRNVFLLTDYLSEDWDESRIDGIRLDSGCLFGLRIGQTTEEEWHQILGEPNMTVIFDEEKAEAYRTVCGKHDYYTWGGHGFQLHSDESGILVSVILVK